MYTELLVVPCATHVPESCLDKRASAETPHPSILHQVLNAAWESKELGRAVVSFCLGFVTCSADAVAGPKEQNKCGVVWHDKASSFSFLWLSWTCYLATFKSTSGKCLWVKVIKSLGRRLWFKELQVWLSSKPWVAGGSGRMEKTFFLWSRWKFTSVVSDLPVFSYSPLLAVKIIFRQLGNISGQSILYVYSNMN